MEVSFILVSLSLSLSLCFAALAQSGSEGFCWQSKAKAKGMRFKP